MLRALIKNWWMVLLQGLLTIGFGIAAIARPGLTLALLLTMLGIYWLIEGASGLFAALKGGKGFWYVLGGIVSILAGIFVFIRPGTTALALLVVIGVWALIRGVTEIVAALHLRKEMEGEIWLILAGVVSVLFGLFVLLRPGQGALAILSVIGLFAILKGLILTILSFKLRGFKGRLEKVAGS
jgi:uncharacterized membrane protein HdeD (DUF308 family)